MSDFNYEVDGKKYKVVKPNALDRKKADDLAAKIFNEGLKDKNQLFNKEKLQILKERQIWSEADEEKMEAARLKVIELVSKIEKGGYEFEEAVEDAKECAKQRQLHMLYSASLNQLLGDTVENKSQEASLNYLIFTSIRNEDGSPVCKNMEEYVTLRETDEVVKEGESLFVDYWFGKVEVPEQKFLEEFGLKEDEEDSEPKKEEREAFIGQPTK